MASNRDLLAPKELTAQEVRDLVNEWVAEGHTITQCAPGAALNFRRDVADASAIKRTKRSPRTAPKRRVGKPVPKKNRGK